MATNLTKISRTFWAERWRFARERTGRRLGPAFRAFSTSWIGLTLSLVFGGLVFGATYVYTQWQAYVAGVFTLLALLASALVGGIAVVLFYFLTAPAAMWRRDQEKIASLQSSLSPALRLEFDPGECIKHLRRGTISQSKGGQRWYKITGSDQHILVQCTNLSQVRIDGVEARVVRLKTPPGGHPGPGFFEPVRLATASRSRTDNVVDLPPGARCFFSVLIQTSQYSRPCFSGQGQPLDYEFLFDRSGVYEIRIEAYGQGTTIAAAELELELEKLDKVDANKRRYAEYEILSVRSKNG